MRPIPYDQLKEGKYRIEPKLGRFDSVAGILTNGLYDITAIDSYIHGDFHINGQTGTKHGHITNAYNFYPVEDDIPVTKKAEKKEKPYTATPEEYVRLKYYLGNDLGVSDDYLARVLSKLSPESNQQPQQKEKPKMKTFRWILTNYVPLCIVFTTATILRFVHPWLMKLAPLIPNSIWFQGREGKAPAEFVVWFYAILAAVVIVLILLAWRWLCRNWYKLLGLRK